MPRVPPAQRLLRKNSRVRVWEMVVEPGETNPLHRHTHPYLSVVLEGTTLIMTDPTGREERLKVRTGDVVWRVPPDAHSVRNVGRTRFRNRLIERLG